jgi:outer membrane receptor for ferrienterochelin and colicins
MNTQPEQFAFWAGVVVKRILLMIVFCFARPIQGASEADIVEGHSDPPNREEQIQIEAPSVEGASKHEQPVSEAPASVSIITRKDIQQYGYRTLGDALRSVRGFYVTYDRVYNSVGVRGVNRPGDFGGRVLVNIDGHRLNEPIFDSAFTHTDFLLDMDLVERVEIIRGPHSSLYGNNAFFTVINVVTRRGHNIDDLEISGAAASYDTFTGRITYGNRFTNGVELLVSGTYLDSDGRGVRFPEFASINNGVAEDLDGTEAKSTFASISYRDFTLEGGFIDREKGVPTAPFAALGAVFNDPHFRYIDERAYAEMKFAHEFENDWRMQARAYYDHYRFDGTYPFNYFAPDPGPITINRDITRSQWVGSEVSVSKTLWERQRLTVGGEYRNDFQLDLSNFDREPRATYVDAERDEYSFAFYGQDEVTIVTNLLLNLGVRYDYFSTFGDTINPRVGIIHSPWRTGTLKFLYGEAFRAPNAYELFYIQPGFKANPDLEEETVRSYEMVYEQALPANLSFSASLFLNQIEELIVPIEDPTDGQSVFVNIDEAEARGVETELAGDWTNGLRGRLSYSYTETRDTFTDKTLENSPRHLGKANLVVPLIGKTLAGAEVQFMSSRRTPQGNKIGEVWLANFTFYCLELGKNVEFSASLFNAFNRKYDDPVSTDYVQDVVPQDGRNFRVKLTCRF